jgi:hypothetical protein
MAAQSALMAAQSDSDLLCECPKGKFPEKTFQDLREKYPSHLL